MNIRRVSLQNFRNFSPVDEIAFPDDALLVAAAPNATGKTNFLEALVMLLRGRSFRASYEECIQWGADNFIIGGQVQQTRDTVSLAVRYHQPSRKLRIEENGVPASPVTFFSHFPVVMFLPEDTYLFTRGPAQRRNFLNRALVSSSAYVSALVQYQRVLKQRNMALKSASSFADVAAWTDLLIEHGLTLWQQRAGLVSFLATQVGELYQSIAGESQSFTIVLREPLPDRAAFMSALEGSFVYERRYGYTLIGPHRDDMVVSINARPIAAALSQGQTRSVVVALKLATQRFVETVTNERPLLLLDEVLSELDERRQERLLEHLPSGQIVLTATAVPAALRRRANVHLLDLRSIVKSRAAAKMRAPGRSAEVTERESSRGKPEPAAVPTA